MKSGDTLTPLQLGLFTLARMVMNTSYRMVYPFLSTFQNGLGMSLGAFSLLLTLRSLTGLIGPLAAPLADWRGRKLSMLLGIGTFTTGALLVTFWPNGTTFFIAVLLMALAYLVFLAAMQAYIGDRVPYHRRGRAMGLTELSWSLAFILGIPLVGWLLGRTGLWQAPFPLLALLGMLAMIALVVFVPGDHAAHAQSSAALNRGGLLQIVRVPAVQIGLGMALAMTTANETVNLVFGLWLENSFGLKLAALGAAAAVIGVAEMGGEGFSAWLVDRLGKEWSVRAGLLLNSLAAVGLVFSGGAVWSALLGLFLFYLSFEFTVVSAMPLMSEALPTLRATVMASMLASFSIGRAVGAVVGPFLYTHWSFPVNAAVAVLFNMIAIALLSRLKIAPRLVEEEG
ncbi:MAG: MFS transporter [Chloroflexi bacterium]|nr:MAG: MFS transporter [Chloroflexota bacterium]